MFSSWVVWILIIIAPMLACRFPKVCKFCLCLHAQTMSDLHGPASGGWSCPQRPWCAEIDQRPAYRSQRRSSATDSGEVFLDNLLCQCHVSARSPTLIFLPGLEHWQGSVNLTSAQPAHLLLACWDWCIFSSSRCVVSQNKCPIMQRLASCAWLALRMGLRKYQRQRACLWILTLWLHWPLPWREKAY